VGILKLLARLFRGGNGVNFPAIRGSGRNQPGLIGAFDPQQQLRRFSKQSTESAREMRSWQSSAAVIVDTSCSWMAKSPASVDTTSTAMGRSLLGL
jgi:hypothetical protein